MTGADRRTRRVRNLVDPVAGAAFTAREVHARFAELGFDDPGEEVEGVRTFDWNAYFAARIAPMGPVQGLVAAAVFTVFEPCRVADAVDEAWAMTTPAALLEARTDGVSLALRRLCQVDDTGAPLAAATEQLEAGLDEAAITGRPLFAGLRSHPVPDDPIARWWQRCTEYREHRMDAHVAALASHGLDGCEACLLNDVRQGLGLGSYVLTRGWGQARVDAAIGRLTERGLLAGDGLSDEGVELRESIEAATDVAQSPIVEAMGDLDAFESLVAPWRQQIIDGFGYPGRRMLGTAARRAAGGPGAN